MSTTPTRDTRTRALHRLLTSTLSGITGLAGAYNTEAPNDAAYPYAIFDARTDTAPDAALTIYTIYIHLWDLRSAGARIDELADHVEDAFNAWNSPQPEIYPTFFRDGRSPTRDAYPDLRTCTVRLTCQLYEHEAEETSETEE